MPVAVRQAADGRTPADPPSDSSRALAPLHRQSFAFATLGLGLFACALAFLPRSFLQVERFAHPKELILHVAALGAALIGLARARQVRGDAADWSLAIFLALGVCSALFAAENPWLAWRALGLSTSGILLFWSARALAEANLQQHLLLGAALTAGCVAGVALLEAYGILDGLSPGGRAPGGTMGNRNRAAHLGVLALPVLWWCVLRVRRMSSLGLLLAGTGAVAAMVVLSRSRAAWLALGILGLFAIAGAIPGIVERRVPARRNAAFVGTVLLGAAAALLLPNSLHWQSSSYLDTARRIADHTTGSGHGRIVQYRNSLEMVGDYPALGVGPGNWSIQYPAYATPGDPSYSPRSLFPTNRLPHSDWIGLAAERGVFAVLALGVAGIALAGASLRRRGAAGCSPERHSSAALGAVLLALFVLGCFDAVLQTPVATYFLATVLGALAPRRSGAPPIALSPPLRWAGFAVVVSLTAIPAVLGVRRVASDHLYAGNATPERLAAAVRVDPANYRAHVLLGAHRARAGQCHLALPHLRKASDLFPLATIPQRLANWCRSRGEQTTPVRSGARQHTPRRVP